MDCDAALLTPLLLNTLLPSEDLRPSADPLNFTVRLASISARGGRGLMLGCQLWERTWVGVGVGGLQGREMVGEGSQGRHVQHFHHQKLSDPPFWANLSRMLVIRFSRFPNFSCGHNQN